jgi:pimeloyl-ACP methyl ester carboxylesterase/DNA-binding CsgD family transcriptional regulator
MMHTMTTPPVQYVTNSDGFNLAYTVSGSGRSLVMVPVGFNHVQLFWENPRLSRWCKGFASHFNLVTFDGRGQGLSTRGLPSSYSSQDRTRDLECVVDHLELHGVVLFGVGSACHTAVHYAAAHPDRVGALVLISCSVTSKPWPPALFRQLASSDWDTFLYANSPQRGGHEAALQEVEQQKRMVTQADFTAMTRAWEGSSIESDLEAIRAPTLVIHPRETRSPSFDDCAEVASRIARARIVVTEGGDGNNRAGDPDSAIGAILSFLAELPPPEPDVSAAPDGLSQREAEVLRLISQGKSNQQVADELVISLHTVKRHVSNVFHKTGVSSRAQAMIYARDRGLSGRSPAHTNTD